METYSFKICLCHVYEDNIKSINLLERNGFDKIHKSWFYQDVLYRKMLNKIEKIELFIFFLKMRVVLLSRQIKKKDINLKMSFF